MSNKGVINNALYRPLKSGNNFNKYIPTSTCKSTFLGEGDTFFSMDGIKENILKNHSQVSKLAPILKKNSLAATANAIYEFLYNHIQYKADGDDQNLRSPACSWSVRKDGIDCKSYSIFTGCILSSLGIKYYIRKIKQPGMLPDQYTHVYIVIPKNQNTANLNGGYHVVDATKHQNTEAAFIQKNDVFMDKLKHFGLQAPAQNAEVVKGFYRPVSEKAKQALEDFLAFLYKVGIAPDVLAAIRQLIHEYLNKGVDPFFAITKEGIVIEDTLFPYIPANSTTKFRSPIKLALIETGSAHGLKGEDGTTEGELGDELGGLIEGMLEDGEWWDNTFGAIFGNGWDLSCWGASNSPKKSGQEVAIDAAAYFKASGLGDASTGGLNTSNLQKFVDMAECYIAYRNFGKTNQDLAKCTRSGNEVGYEGMKKALAEVISAADRLLKEKGGSLTRGTAKTISNYNFPAPSGYAGGKIDTDNRFTVTAATYTVYAPTPIVVPPPNTGGGSTPNTGGNSGGGNTGGGTVNTGGGSTGGNSGGGSNSTGGNSGGNPALYNRLPPIEKNIYDYWKATGSLQKLYDVRQANPTYYGSDSLMTLLGLPKNPKTSTLTPPKSQQAGMNPLVVLGLIAGGFYLYKQNKK